MNKRIKWGNYRLVGAGLTALGIHTFTPGENKELAAAEKKSPVDKNKSAECKCEDYQASSAYRPIVRKRKADAGRRSGPVIETSGKITNIEFTEGSFVSKGQLLAKVNDSQLQAQLKRLEARCHWPRTAYSAKCPAATRCSQ